MRSMTLYDLAPLPSSEYIRYKLGYWGFREDAYKIGFCTGFLERLADKTWYSADTLVVPRHFDVGLIARGTREAGQHGYNNGWEYPVVW